MVADGRTCTRPGSIGLGHPSTAADARTPRGCCDCVVHDWSLPETVIAEDEAATTVHAITMAHRRLDGISSSAELIQPVLAHLRMASNMQAEVWDPLSGKAVVAAVSEAAGLAGWLHWDMHDLGSARRHYRLAVEQAQRRGEDSMLTAYMLAVSRPSSFMRAKPVRVLPTSAMRSRLPRGSDQPSLMHGWRPCRPLRTRARATTSRHGARSIAPRKQPSAWLWKCRRRGPGCSRSTLVRSRPTGSPAPCGSVVPTSLMQPSKSSLWCLPGTASKAR